MEKDGSPFFLEFNGCAYHPGCPNCPQSGQMCKDKSSKANYDRKKYEDLGKLGKVIVQWECDWDKRLAAMDEKPQTPMGRILHSKETEESLLNSIKNGEVFGFCVVDVKTPRDMIEKRFKNFLFPPIFKRGAITKEMLSPYTLEQVEENPDYILPDKTVIQGYNAKQILLMTPLIRLYMQEGLEVSNPTRFIQYQPGKALKPFQDKVVKMRVEATHEGDDSKQLTAKVFIIKR